MKKLAWLFAPLALVGAAPPAPKPEPAKPALWVLKDEDTTLYLFGTIHMLPKDYAWRTAMIDTALAESSDLVLEVADDDSPEATGQAFAKLAMSPGLSPVLDRLPEAKRASAKTMLEESGIPLEALDQFESWAVALTLSVTAIQKLGLLPEHGVESVLTDQFKAAKKPISGLETTEQQLGFFDTLPEEAQRTFLASAVDDTADLKKEFDGMVASWAAGDEAKIALTFDDELKLSPELLDRLLRQRNANWTVWIKDRMDKPGTSFIAVGAGHLAGKDSVQSMLAAKGLVVTRLQ
jgi:uncharacterized protein